MIDVFLFASTKSISFCPSINVYDKTIFQNKISIFEPKNCHYNFGSLDNKYLEIAANMFAKKKLKVYYQKFIFDKKEIMNGFELIKSRRTKGKLVYEINTV